MRTLLICAGVCLTAGTYVAAERFTSSSQQTFALERQAEAQAAVDAQIKAANEKFTDEIAGLKSVNEEATTQIASLNSTIQEVTSERNDLAVQIVEAKTLSKTASESLAKLEAQNGALMQRLDVRDASLSRQKSELDALKAQLNVLANTSNSSSGTSEGNAGYATEIASLNAELQARDETIASLQERIEASENATADASIENAEDVNSALVEELAAAKATIDELNQEASESDASLSAMNDALSERDSAVAQLQAEISEMAAALPDASASGDSSEQTERLAALSERLETLTSLVDSQTKTISNLRMGFEEEASSAMDMANACIDRANKIFEISQIKFATGTSAISEESITTLDHLRDLAIGCESEEMFIEIGGHTDSLGQESANQLLSEARAESVREFLIGRGIPDETMVAVGFGEANPIATNDTPEGRAQNRRITFTWQMREKTPEVVDATATTENNEG